MREQLLSYLDKASFEIWETKSIEEEYELRRSIFSSPHPDRCVTSFASGLKLQCDFLAQRSHLFWFASVSPVLLRRTEY